MATSRTGRLTAGTIAGLVAGIVVAALWLGGGLDRWEEASWDARVQLLARPSSAADSVVVILLDQASLDWGEEVNGWSWPWPREVYTAIIGACREAGARSLALDMVFTEDSIYGVDDDRTFAAALAERPDCVVPIDIQPPAAPGDSSRITPPIPEIAAAAHLGNVSDSPDADGVFRRARVVTMTPGGPVASLGLATYLLAQPAAARSLVVEAGEVRAGEQRIPVDRKDRALLRFAPAGTYATFSAAAVIQSYLKAQESQTAMDLAPALAGRYVLLGPSAPALRDQRPTPVQSVSSGVMIHATVIDDLLGAGFMHTAPRGLGALLVALLGAVAGLALAAGHGPRPVLLGAAGLLPVPAIAALIAYNAGWWWPLVPGELATAGGLVAGLAVNYATEGRQRRFLKQAFRFYLSPDVIERLLADPGQLRLGGERRTLSIFFSDLAGFTSIGEKLDAEPLTALLNEYLTAMTDIILAEGGTLDKYEGDAIIAFWNAPLDVPDHALRACQAAVRCQRELAERRAEWLARYGCELRMRIGVHTGAAVVGNLGSQQRFDYSMLGDAANLASRLEGVNKVFGTSTIVSRVTRDLAGEQVLTRELGDVVVVGRREAVTVCELGGLVGDVAPASWAAYATALRCCREGRRDEALQALHAATDDPASSELAARLAADPQFRGTWSLTQK